MFLINKNKKIKKSTLKYWWNTYIENKFDYVIKQSAEKTTINILQNFKNNLQN